MSTPQEQGAAEKAPASAAPVKAPFSINFTNALIAFLVLVILIQMFTGGADEEEPAVQPLAGVAALPAPESPAAMATGSPPVTVADMSDGIERKGEGRLFYTTIRIPAHAETLYLSGTGASAKPDGSWGTMEEQAIDTFTKFKATLESEGWSMSDVVQVRAFAVADEYGILDFEGFNRGYQQFFGTPGNPTKPVRSFVQVADLVVDGWLVEVEIRAARVPAGS